MWFKRNIFFYVSLLGFLFFTSKACFSQSVEVDDSLMMNELKTPEEEVFEASVEKKPSFKQQYVSASPGPWKAFRKFKKAHPNEVAFFKKNQARLKAEMRDPHSSLYQTLQLAAQTCKEDAESCEAVVNTIVSPQIDLILNPQSTAWLDAWLNSAVASDSTGFSHVCKTHGRHNENGRSLHMLVFGWHKLVCSQAKFDVQIKAYGPGFWGPQGEEVVHVSCMNDQVREHNIGFYAGVCPFGGITFGTFFGGNGICAVLGFNWGFGAFASIADLTLK